MRRYIGFRDFVQRDQRSLVGTGLLLTGSHEQAIRLALRAYRTVGLAWPPAPWENPATHAHTELYRAFLRRPTAAGATALVKIPPRRRLITVACLHEGRTPAEMADVLGLSVETVESEIAEALDTLTKGDRKRLVNRFATQAGEASVPDLSGRALTALRRRGRRRILLTAVVLILLVAFIVTLTPQGQVWTTALAAGDRTSRASAATPQTAPPSASSPSSGPAAGSGDSSAEPSAAPAAWKTPRTSSVIRYAVPATCRGERSPRAGAGRTPCSGWTLTLVAGRSPGDRSGLPAETCEGRSCGTAVDVPDAVQDPGAGGAGRREAAPAISRDGRRVAYLSAAEHRYVAHDLPTGTKRYLSPVLTPADRAAGTSVGVSGSGRYFTVALGERRLRTDFTTGATADLPAGAGTPAEKAAAWLDEEYAGWAPSPSGRHAAAASEGKTGCVLHIVDPASRRTTGRFPLPAALGGPTDCEVAGWPDAGEVVVRMTDRASGDFLGFYRVGVRGGEMRRVPGLPGDDRIVLGAVTAP
ncbi:hypothetical protein ACFOWE_06295 [Planomonospora corallina]|uniref:Uncharacterized protein n=1 Tax=Planomonospora corallina TaxID=1806052 RepID=A0ABV8I4C2_9ACTN